MSTKSTIYLNKNIHVYTDYLSDKFIFIDVTLAELRTTLRLPLIDFASMSAYFNLGSVKKQSEVTDEEILKFVKEQVSQRSVGDSINALWGLGLYGASTSPKEEQISNGFNHFVKKRNETIKIMENIKRIKPRTIHFGLEDIINDEGL